MASRLDASDAKPTRRTFRSVLVVLRGSDGGRGAIRSLAADGLTEAHLVVGVPSCRQSSTRSEQIALFLGDRGKGARRLGNDDMIEGLVLGCVGSCRIDRGHFLRGETALLFLLTFRTGNCLVFAPLTAQLAPCLRLASLALG